MASLKDIDVAGKKVLVRVDFNVPLDDEHKITDDTRMKKALPTIRYLLEHEAAVILMSHLGRPQKDKNEDGSIKKDKYSLKYLAEHLTELTGVRVIFCEASTGPEAELAVEKLEPCQILLLENTRFNEGEKKGDEEYAQMLSRLADIYVNDAFGTAHRKHSSTATVAQFFDPDKKALGLLMEGEIANAEKALMNPARPFVAVIGGAKVSDKIKLLSRIVEVANMVVIGGAMAYTFIKAQDGEVGDSLYEKDFVQMAKDVLNKAADLGTEIYLPQDSVIAQEIQDGAETKFVPSDQIPSGWKGLDIGPEARNTFTEVIMGAHTIVWNGPMGVFEMEAFAGGTNQVARAVAEATANGAFSLIGGGDSVAAINKAQLADQVSFISTGGGAMLEYLEGKKLPGIVAVTG